MSDSTSSNWSYFDREDQDDGDQITDTSNISWRMQQNSRARERKEKLRQDLVRERFENKSRREAPPQSLLDRLLRRR